MLVVAELNGSGNQISEGSVTDVLNKPTIIHTDLKKEFISSDRLEFKKWKTEDDIRKLSRDEI